MIKGFSLAGNLSSINTNAIINKMAITIISIIINKKYLVNYNLVVKTNLQFFFNHESFCHKNPAYI